MTTGLALIAATAIVRGLVLSVLWGWFVVPLGVTDIGAVEAIGLMTSISFIVYRPPDEASKQKVKEQGAGKAFVAGISTSIFISLFALGMGWLVHLFL